MLYTIFAKRPYKLYFLISTYDFGMTVSVRNVDMFQYNLSLRESKLQI